MARPTVSFDQAIRHIMRTQHKTRSQARAMLIQAVRSGHLPAHIMRDGEVVRLQPSELPPAEH
jgi:hypothetical protein